MENGVVVDLVVLTLHDDAVEPDVPNYIVVDAYITALIVGTNTKTYCSSSLFLGVTVVHPVVTTVLPAEPGNPV